MSSCLFGSKVEDMASAQVKMVAGGQFAKRVAASEPDWAPVSWLGRLVNWIGLESRQRVVDARAGATRWLGREHSVDFSLD
jgi:hypothetical protein